MVVLARDLPGVVPIQQRSCELGLRHWCLSLGESLHASLILGRANNKMVEDLLFPIIKFRVPTLELSKVVRTLSGKEIGDVLPD